MPAIKLSFNHIDISKTSVCFTWDDNFTAHMRLIAPQFLKRGLRCTFYINPGEPCFEEKFLPLYRALSKTGFEIGSHGYRHDNYLKVPLSEFECELKKAASAIGSYIGVYPATFAFPYHDYNDETMQTAGKHHIETRNTLGGSRRFGIKADSRLDDMIKFANGCVLGGLSMVFSGHSAIPADTESADEEDPGYEPITLQNLSALLDHLQTLRESAEVLTLEQAALKKYIINHCGISGNSYILSYEQADWLNTFHINANMLSLLI